MEKQARANENLMGTEAIRHLLLRTGIPLMLSLLINSLYNFVDSVFVSQVTDESVTWLPAERIANHATEEDLRAWAQSIVTKVTDVKDGGEMHLKIGDTKVSVVWEDNDAVRELKRMAAERPVSVEMSM